MGSLTLGPDRHGRIVRIVEGRVSDWTAADTETIPCPNGEIEPGAVCAHTHLYSGLVPFGVPPVDPPPADFRAILERIWWRLDRALDVESLAAAARVAVAEALLAGTTGLVDHHESPGFIEGSLAVLAAACEGLGIRALVCYGATERNGGRSEALRGLSECRRVTRTRLVRPLVGLHAGFTVSDETVAEAGDLARSLDTVLHVHLAEAADDVADARARGYAGCLDRLERLGAHVPGSIFAHGVHLDRGEVEAIAAAGSWLVQNPRSNRGNRVGYPNGLRHSDRVALGTDGWPADMAEENRALARLAGENHDDRWRERLPAGRALLAERFGVAATGFDDGALGDFVVREDDLVRHVVVEGRVVVRDGRLVGTDIGLLRAEAESEARRLGRRMAAF